MGAVIEIEFQPLSPATLKNRWELRLTTETSLRERSSRNTASSDPYSVTKFRSLMLLVTTDNFRNHPDFIVLQKPFGQFYHRLSIKRTIAIGPKLVVSILFKKFFGEHYPRLILPSFNDDIIAVAGTNAGDGDIHASKHIAISGKIPQADIGNVNIELRLCREPRIHGKRRAFQRLRRAIGLKRHADGAYGFWPHVSPTFKPEQG